MSGYTPGPWLIIDKSFVYALNERGTNIFWAHAYGGWKGKRANERTSAEEVEANANLIAAAPDLLEALQSLVRHAEKLGRHCELYDKARAAIAKAKGEQQ